MNSRDQNITIGICVYNPTLEFSNIISSWSAQLSQGNELLIYDDGSETPTNILTSTNKKGVRIIRSEENKGIGYGRNVIYTQAKNDIIMFADADDISRPDRIAISLANFFSHSKSGYVNLVYATSEKIYTSGITVVERPNNTSFRVNELIERQTNISNESFITPASVLMFSRSEVKTGFDENFRRLEDIEWLWHLNTKMPINLISTKEILVERYDEKFAAKKHHLNHESEIKLFEKYSQIIGCHLTNFNQDWSRLKFIYFERKTLHLLSFSISFLIKYKVDAVRKLLIGAKRRLKKC